MTFIHYIHDSFQKNSYKIAKCMQLSAWVVTNKDFWASNPNEAINNYTSYFDQSLDNLVPSISHDQPKEGKK